MLPVLGITRKLLDPLKNCTSRFAMLNIIMSQCHFELDPAASSGDEQPQ
jgi:hypothetical protein